MKSKLIIAMFIMVTGNMYAQNPESHICKRWLYLDQNWKKITDTAHYAYKRLTTIDDRTNIHPMGPYGKSNYVLRNNTDTLSKNSKILNGNYIWYDQNGVKKSEHVFLNGELISTKEYRKNGKVKANFEYKSFPNEKGIAFYIYEYNKDMTVLRVSEVKKDEKGNWPVMR